MAFSGNGDVARHLLTELEALKQRISDLERSSQIPRQSAPVAERPPHRDLVNEDVGGDQKEQDAGKSALQSMYEADVHQEQRWSTSLLAWIAGWGLSMVPEGSPAGTAPETYLQL